MAGMGWDVHLIDNNESTSAAIHNLFATEAKRVSNCVSLAKPYSRVNQSLYEN